MLFESLHRLYFCVTRMVSYVAYSTNVFRKPLFIYKNDKFGVETRIYIMLAVTWPWIQTTGQNRLTHCSTYMFRHASSLQSEGHWCASCSACISAISITCITYYHSSAAAFFMLKHEGRSESKERFPIQRYSLIIGKKQNMQVLSHTFTYFSTQSPLTMRHLSYRDTSLLIPFSYQTAAWLFNQPTTGIANVRVTIPYTTVRDTSRHCSYTSLIVK